MRQRPKVNYLFLVYTDKEPANPRSNLSQLLPSPHSYSLGILYGIQPRRSKRLLIWIGDLVP